MAERGTLTLAIVNCHAGQAWVGTLARCSWNLEDTKPSGHHYTFQSMTITSSPLPGPPLAGPLPALCEPLLCLQVQSPRHGSASEQGPTHPWMTLYRVGLCTTGTNASSVS